MSGYKWATPHDWLYQAIKEGRVTSEEIWLLLQTVDADTIQDQFQSSMAEDGYFKQALTKEETWVIVAEPQERRAMAGDDIEFVDFFWENDYGWTFLEDASRFSESETKTMHLPMHGEWMKLTEAEELVDAEIEETDEDEEPDILDGRDEYGSIE